MCGIGGLFDLQRRPCDDLDAALHTINEVQRHRGPDGSGVWRHADKHVGLAHRRLSIIDLGAGHQPMEDGSGNWIAFNGEIYNYLELREELGTHHFRTHSDTEVILQAYRRWGVDCVEHLRGMFAFALWDEREQRLFCARDRFGIKPFYYAVVDDRFVFASEIKALLPFLHEVAVDEAGLTDYLTFQFCLNGKTMFKGVRELPPAHTVTVTPGRVDERRYWNVHYRLDFDHTPQYFENRLHELLDDSVDVHLRSDVPVGAYLSGGLDSSLVSALAADRKQTPIAVFNGKFTEGPEFDESHYARVLAEERGLELHEIPITVDDLTTHLRDIIYHLDQPVAGPGSFPQYMVSRYAGKHRKVVLGGQGGDEIFGGYARYLIAYFEQCIRGAIDGTMNNGKFVVTYESIIPNLSVLQAYKPLLKTFFANGMFEDLANRYFRLVNRAPELTDEVDWKALKDHSPLEGFLSIFRAPNVESSSYFDAMTHFDLKTLLPALLHVEDRVSMAHGLESRVPLLDHPLVEFAGSIPADVKFRDGRLKHLLKEAARKSLPTAIVDRKDKMGFPVPLTQWLNGPAQSFVLDVFNSQAAKERSLINNRLVVERMGQESRYGRKLWGLLSLELWQQTFIDRGSYWKSLLKQPPKSIPQTRAA
jgi:asparagine synthase (glutamine-hydrolysing)